MSGSSRHPAPNSVKSKLYALRHLEGTDYRTVADLMKFSMNVDVIASQSIDCIALCASSLHDPQESVRKRT